MAITTAPGTHPEQTAKEYAIKFELAANDPSVKWVGENAEQYLKLVRMKDELTRANDIDPDKFPIKMKVDPVPNAFTIANEIKQKSLWGSDVKQPTESRHFITINTGIFHPTFNDADVKHFIAHEIGHQINPHTPERQTAFVSETFRSKLGAFKPLKKTLSETSQLVWQDEEIRADSVAAQLTCSPEGMASALQKLGDIKLVTKSGDIIAMDDVSRAQGSTHPNFDDRIKALSDAAPGIKKNCHKK